MCNVVCHAQYTVFCALLFVLTVVFVAQYARYLCVAHCCICYSICLMLVHCSMCLLLYVLLNIFYIALFCTLLYVLVVVYVATYA